MSAPCFRCGKRGEHDHHLTLRDDRGERMDDELVVWLCGVCHKQAHNVLRILELEYVRGPLSVPERIEVRLRRVAAFLALLGVPWSPLTAPLATAMTRWADDLAVHTRDLYTRCPDWRLRVE
jgi:hypothetical protein